MAKFVASQLDDPNNEEAWPLPKSQTLFQSTNITLQFIFLDSDIVDVTEFPIHRVGGTDRLLAHVRAALVTGPGESSVACFDKI